MSSDYPAVAGDTAADAVGTAVTLVRCHDCDLLQAVPALTPGAEVRCPRCGAALFSIKRASFTRAFALYLAAAILLVIANVFPFLTMRVQGREQSSDLLSGAFDLMRSGMWEVGVAVVLFVTVFPLIKIGTSLAVLGSLSFGTKLRGAEALYRLFDRLHPWAMMEIFFLGVLVAYTKLVDLATVILGPALYAFVALIVVTILADTAVDPQQVWEKLKPARPRSAPARRERHRLRGCHTCQLVSPVPTAGPPGAPDVCPRCGSALHARKPDSLNRTAALLLTAAILYVPANLYPVMTFEMLGKGEPSTILGGVEELIAANMWPLAAIVFTASIAVPVLKLISMGWLVLSVRRGARRRLKDRTRIYRLNELVGRWSMVDVFVIAILVALVQLGAVATIQPGIGILAFAGGVVLTMLAAASFDPRLIWDAAGANDDPDRQS